jgi:hypothetical protein
MGLFTLRFRVRSKDDWSPNKKKIVLTATRLAEDANMTENQAHFVEGESPQNEITLFMDKATGSTVFTKGSDVLVTFNGPAA